MTSEIGPWIQAGLHPRIFFCREQKKRLIWLQMANLTYERGACTPPFLQLSKFQSSNGCKPACFLLNCLSCSQDVDLPGRFCAPVPSVQGTIDCCLPCPLTDWVYSDSESFSNLSNKTSNSIGSQDFEPYQKLSIGSMLQA